MKFNTNNLDININQSFLDVLPKYSQTLKTPERGGVIMGELYPNKNLVVITNIIESPSKLKRNNRYEMDVKYIQKEINKIWKKSKGTVTYLGDWHTHPEINPKPSLIDYYTFSKNYFNSSIDQNFLIYIILGLKVKNDILIWIGVCNGIKTKRKFGMSPIN
ncbi:Mov34/MPN/PAD-1 family protein [Sulfurimonas sp.]|uniref:Mov34/MPN/PAD-1 family protein n=1 Tax=Sulfurimonas sp. TaxID=2022749 RepID=UPI002622B59A|nr:Mov34/MPN/PAD-1 family protein [Sulfurimonas sp.]MDD5156830.1 Mov34/MPN/PAD-1 family protein [Sulfurimonas sp.]